MANEQNLMPISEVNSRRTREEHSNDSKKAGVNSGKARKRKADLRRMAQEVLDGTYKDRRGNEITGEEAVIRGLVANLTDPQGKNWGKAMDLLVTLLGANKSREEKQQIKAQTALTKAKVDMLTGADTSALDRLDAILGAMKNNAEHSTDSESEAE
jgi:hypothetical protein